VRTWEPANFIHLLTIKVVFKSILSLHRVQAEKMAFIFTTKLLECDTGACAFHLYVLKVKNVGRKILYEFTIEKYARCEVHLFSLDSSRDEGREGRGLDV